LLLILARFLTVWAGTPFPIDLVTSDSMSPTLLEGDIVAWTPVNIENIKVGDVVVFKSYVHWPEEKIVVHRVSNITTNSRDEILLETKGDHNTWTDQSGPHIPEPYIRKDHVMGKVLSIGQIPLRIPLIGYLGVWINQGLNSISQPSSAKESISYVGIFAPLTISVVILVILIFILPEKAHTIKEKIHFNIFGHRPLNMKKTFITFLIAYVVFLTVIHCFAYDSLSTSVGVDSIATESSMNFGTIQPGTESEPISLPLLNPSTMPVKGIAFGRGSINEFIEGQVFQLERGEEKTTTVKAVGPSDTKTGSYKGDIMIYSSPFWLIFPDDFINNLINWNPEITVYILDLIIAIFLTFITISMLLLITFTGEKLVNWTIDRSWYHPSRVIIQKQTAKKAAKIKNNIKSTLGKTIGWVIRLDFSEIKYREKIKSFVGKPIIASLLVLPIMLFLEDKILAMLLSVIIAGVLAYFISCKLRYKIILTALIASSIAIVHMLILSNMIIISQQHTIIEIMALSLGAIGIYLLILAILLLPLSLISWILTRFIRNLKERKNPLLSLEGSCDL